MHIKHDTLFDKVAQESIRKLHLFKPQELSNTVWAFATMNIKHDILFDKIAQETFKILHKLNSQDISNTVWAFATINIKHDALFNKIYEYLINDWKNRITYCDKVYCQLYQWQLWIIHEIELQKYIFPTNMFTKCKDIFNNYIPNISNFHKDVKKYIIDGQIEYLTEFGYSIDIAFPDKKIGIEVNGPSHYLSDNTLNGASILKYRQLYSFGWKIICIPYFEWDNLLEQDKQNYIDDKLRDIF
jgi:hypothetical protein